MKISLSLFLFFCSLICRSQPSGNLYSPYKINRVNYQIGYQGDMLVNPGIQLAVEIPLADTFITSKGQSTMAHTNAIVQLHSYYKPKYHSAVGIDVGLNYRWTKSNYRFFQVQGVVGYQSNFIPGPTFEVGSDGLLTSKRFQTYGTLHNQLSMALGRDVRTSAGHRRLMRYFYGLGVDGLLPINSAYVPSLRINAGIHFKLGWRSHEYGEDNF